MGEPRNGSYVGWAVRIYRNAAGKRIGLHDIAIMEQLQKIRPEKFHRSLSYEAKFVWINCSDDDDRTIASIKMVGDYENIKSDFSSAWWPADPNTLDNEMVFEDRLYNVGDTIGES